MGQYTYYCEVRVCDRMLGYNPGVYKVVADKEINGHWFPKLNRIITISDRVWKQGPRGGVKMVKGRNWDFPMGYITTDEKWMKKFAWVKLSAKSI
jgi:hypothetical protein